MKKISGFIIFSFVVAGIFFVKNFVFAASSWSINWANMNISNQYSYAANYTISGALSSGDAIQICVAANGVFQGCLSYPYWYTAHGWETGAKSISLYTLSFPEGIVLVSGFVLNPWYVEIPWSEVSYAVIHDTIAPTTPVLSLPANTWFLNNWTANLLRSASTDTNMSWYIWQLSTWSNFSTIYSSWSVTAIWTTITWLADNTYYWRVRAFDIVGNTWARSSTWNFIISIPFWSITWTNITGGNVDSYTAIITISWALDTGNIIDAMTIDASGHVNPLPEYTANGWETWLIILSRGVGGINDGVTELRGRVFVDSGYYEIIYFTGTVIKDTIAPTFAWVTSWAYYNTSKSIIFSESNSWATATLSWASYTSWQNITWGGIYVFRVADSFGNSTWATFTIDKISPTTPNLLLSGYLTTWTANLLRSASTDTNMSWYIWQLSTWSSFTTIYISWSVLTTWKTITWLADNTYYYQVYAFDKAGNTWSRNSGSFIVDTTVPTAAVAYSTTATTNWNVTATITWLNETITWLSASSYVFTGNWSYVFTFSDLAWNTGTITATVTWITTASNWWGGWGLAQDSCPNGDTSASFYDGTCNANTNQQTNWSIVWSNFSTEFNNAYLYAYGIGITTMQTIQKADMEWKLIRSDMAKMMVNYAIKVLDRTLNTWTNCTFTDLAGQTTEMKNYILRSCQLGLMGINTNNKFNPKDEVTRAEFGTILSRILYGTRYEWGILYYTKHLDALRVAGIMNNIKNPENIKELRWYVMLMLMRAGE